MTWLLTAVLCIVLVELALRLPFASAVAGVGRPGARAYRVVRAKAVSDHWKEKALSAYAQTTFLSSLKLGGLLALLLGVAAIVVLAFDSVLDGFDRFVLGWRGIAFSVVFASLYLMARRSALRGRL